MWLIQSIKFGCQKGKKNVRALQFGFNNAVP